jgi:hypothetical protein
MSFRFGPRLQTGVRELKGLPKGSFNKSLLQIFYEFLCYISMQIAARDDHSPINHRCHGDRVLFLLAL